MIQRVAMTLCLRFLLVAILFFGLSFAVIGTAYAADCSVTYGTSFVTNNIDGKNFNSGTQSISFAIRGSTLANGDVFDLYLDKTGVGNGLVLDTKEVSNNQLSFTITHDDALKGTGGRSLALQKRGGDWCDNLANYTLVEGLRCNISLSQNKIPNPSCYDTDSGDITVSVTSLTKGLDTAYSGDYFNISFDGGAFSNFTANNGSYTTTFKPVTGRRDVSIGAGTRAETFVNPSAFIPGICKIAITISQGKCNSVIPNQPQNGTGVEMQERVFQLCTQITNTQLKGKCDECFAKKGVWTAVGCIERTPQNIVKTFLEIGLGVGGGICLLMCLAAGFMITTSQGDPKQVSEGREMITSAVIGLLFIIFSVFILQFIGVTIFNIPGFGVGPKP
jgi:hypothetical protein